jgi:hypothetical protein
MPVMSLLWHVCNLESTASGYLPVAKVCETLSVGSKTVMKGTHARARARTHTTSMVISETYFIPFLGKKIRWKLFNKLAN